tara:strand:+ start:1012 stop:1278 length:267 start_codon:yes stop_codon:yes gene_type:complete
VQLKFMWIPQEKKFHFELRNGERTMVALWMSPKDVVNLFNVILGELRRASLNPDSLPKPIALTDPHQAAADKILEGLTKTAGSEGFEN